SRGIVLRRPVAQSCIGTSFLAPLSERARTVILSAAGAKDLLFPTADAKHVVSASPSRSFARARAARSPRLTRRGAPCEERKNKEGSLARDYPHLHGRRPARGAVHPDRRRAIVRAPSLEDIGHERLRVPVDEREPGALHLDHDAVSLEEAVILAV